MSDRHAICLCIDGLRASALGTYGSTACPTPQLDALASRAVVVDWLFADSPTREGFYRSVWEGQHALRRVNESRLPADPQSILRRLSESAFGQLLVSDEHSLIKQADDLPFDQAVFLENHATSSADEMELTCLTRFFSQAIEQIVVWRESEQGINNLVWLHSQGMAGPWDAPLTMREQLLAEDDPAAAEFVQPPRAQRDIDDPDEILAFRTAYAAQVMVLDTCIGAFVDTIEDLFAGSETLIMLFGSRGFPLGEHGSVGTDCAELYSEALHLPWLLLPCGNRTPLPRQSSLSQPADIGATLLDWFGLGESLGATDGLSLLPTDVASRQCNRQLIAAVGESGESMVRTPAWSLTEMESTDKPTAPQLFTKPDDRWECNDISALCPEVVDQLRSELRHLQSVCQTDQPLPLQPQREELLEAVR